jgi:hypothetical protein
MKSFTLFGYENHRYFVPANNPYGHAVWFETREQRDAAVEELEEHAKEKGLSSPRFARIEKRIRTEEQRDWVFTLQDRGILRANGIDGPQNSMSHSWGDEG